MLTVLLWLLVVISWAYLYGRSGLVAAMRAPEDGNWTWGFWLLMFAIFRLPVLIVALGAVVLTEMRLVKGENGIAPSRN
jgi:hypothetical protein